MWTIKIKTLSGGLTLQLVVVVPWCADDGDGDGDGFGDGFGDDDSVC